MHACRKSPRFAREAFETCFRINTFEIPAERMQVVYASITPKWPIPDDDENIRLDRTILLRLLDTSFLSSAGPESQQRVSRNDSSGVQQINPQRAPKAYGGHNRERQSQRETAQEYDQRIQRRRDQLLRHLRQREAYQMQFLRQRQTKKRNRRVTKQVQELRQLEREQSQELHRLKMQLHHDYVLLQQSRSLSGATPKAKTISGASTATASATPSCAPGTITSVSAAASRTRRFAA